MIVVELVERPIEPGRILQSVQDPLCGASILFLGSTRSITDGRQTTRLNYDCYPSMARTALAQLAAEAQRRWPVRHVAIEHRIAEVPVGEASVAIAVSSPHRQAAFEAGQWLIDTLKTTVPIWKQEQYADGMEQWQHPDQTPHPLPGSN